jgi:predicted dehydrogenase
MSKKNLSLRKFINKTALGITGTALSTMAGFSVITSVAAMSASSYKRIMGANDRINIAFLGCGWRSHGHQNMVKMSVKDKNLGVVAVCDLRNHNREKTAARCKEMFGNEVRQFMYSEDLLNMKNRNAVMIATGDFQHAKVLAEVVRAGKDCYCEKPMAQDIAEAKMVREAVLTSKQIVQNGSQWLSDPMQIKVRDIVPSGSWGR